MFVYIYIYIYIYVFTKLHKSIPIQALTNSLSDINKT